MGEDALVGPALGHLGESVVPFLYNDDDQIDLIWLDVILFLSQLDRQHFLRMTEKAHLYKIYNPLSQSAWYVFMKVM